MVQHGCPCLSIPGGFQEQRGQPHGSLQEPFYWITAPWAESSSWRRAEGVVRPGKAPACSLGTGPACPGARGAQLLPSTAQGPTQGCSEQSLCPQTQRIPERGSQSQRRGQCLSERDGNHPHSQDIPSVCACQVWEWGQVTTVSQGTDAVPSPLPPDILPRWAVLEPAELPWQLHSPDKPRVTRVLPGATAPLT